MTHMTTPTWTRRDFARTVALAGATTALTRARAQGANERIRVGFIGVGNRGSQLLARFMKEPNVEVAALCDVYDPYLRRDREAVDPRIVESLNGTVIPAMDEEFPDKVRRYHDFREMLERKDIDAVCIATPDHWHAIQTILACDAGKDVYVEKPLSIVAAEGRRMIDAAKRTKRVVQVGIHRRGSAMYREVVEKIRGGAIGKVTVARAYHVSGMSPVGIGKMKPTDPPPALDWDLWLGPRASRPFQFNIAPYKFRWWKEYSSQMGNFGVHWLDIIRWAFNEDGPAAVTAVGGKYAIDDDRTIPDTMEATFEFASGALAIFGIYEANGTPPFPAAYVEFRGTLGTLTVGDRGYSIDPSPPGQFQKSPATPLAAFKSEPVKEDPTQSLIHNFIENIKSRGGSLQCDLETGHRSTCLSHLANIALETKARLEWDTKTEKVKNLKEANRFLDYKYREPWKA